MEGDIEKENIKNNDNITNIETTTTNEKMNALEIESQQRSPIQQSNTIDNLFNNNEIQRKRHLENSSLVSQNGNHSSEEICSSKKKKATDKINISMYKEENHSDEQMSGDEKEVFSLLVSNLPFQWTHENITDYIQEHCLELYALEQLDGGDSETGQTIQLFFSNFEKCNQARKQLKLKAVEGCKLSVAFCVPEDSDSDTDTEKSLLVKREIKRPVSSPEKPDLDMWASDPNGTYGLKMEYLKSLGIEPPIDKWIHVSNFRCDKTELKEVLELAGHVVICTVINGFNKYANVMYSHPLEAVQAVSMLNGQILYGQTLKLSLYKNLKNETLLPKGLVNVGPGLGAYGKPMRDIVKQYERHLNGKTSSINNSIFMDTIYTPDFSTINSGIEHIESVVSLNTDVISSEKQNDLSKKINNQLALTENQNIGTTEPIATTLINSSITSTPNTLKQNLHQTSVVTGPMSAPTNVGFGWSQSTTSVSQLFTNNPVKSQLRNMSPSSSVTRPTNPSLINITGGPNHQAYPLPQFTGPSTSFPTIPQGVGLHAPIGVRPPNITPRAILCAPFHAVRNSGPLPNVCSTSTNSWLNPVPNLNNLPQKPIVEASRNMCGTQQPRTLSSTVELRNLPNTTTFPLLSEKMAQVGQVMSLELTRAGCALVRFASPVQATKCYQHFNKMCVMGNIIEVKLI